MAKLGWVLAAALAGLLVIGAKAPMDDSKQLEEIKALLTENNRVQRIDVHRRAYKEHHLLQGCDLEKKCDDFERRAATHRFEIMDPGAHPELWVGGAAPPKYFHPFTGECGGYGPTDSCKKVEEAFREANKERIEQILKTYKRKE